MLLIPESRKRPITESLLYKQIIRFLEEEKIRDKVEIAFISIKEGIVTLSHGYIANAENNNVAMKQCNNVPPLRFRSGALWVKKAQIEQMANSIVDYLRFKILDLRFYKSKIINHKSEKVIAYVRGAYLEAVRLANKKLLITNYQLQITELFTDDELAQLRKRGIMWMKVGLRMPTAFIIFRMKMRYLVMESEDRQLMLF